MEFDKSKILTVVTADQAKVGMKGWFADDLEMLERVVARDKPSELIHVYGEEQRCRFEKEISNTLWSLFYPAPEPTYEERQAEWVKENNVKVGTKVRFTKGFKTAEDGSRCREHRDAKGIEGVVSSVEDEFLLVRIPSDGWAVPFTALEVIKEPTYRPYNSEELNYIVGNILVRKCDGSNVLVNERSTPIKVRLGDGCAYTAEQLIELFTLNDEPCGVREEA